MDLLLSLRHPRCLQSLCGGLDGGSSGEFCIGQEADCYQL